MARYAVAPPKVPEPIQPNPLLRFIWNLLQPEDPKAAVQGMANPLGMALPGSQYLGQVRNLERIYRVLEAMGAMTQRTTTPGVHPERYAIEFLTKGLSEKSPLMGRVVAPMNDPKKLMMLLNDPSFSGQPLTSYASPLHILQTLRSLFGK